MTRKDKIKNLVLNILIIITAIILVCTVIFTIVKMNNPTSDPGEETFFGLKPIIIESDSMEPTIMTGGLVIGQKVDFNTLQEGDIITFEMMNGLEKNTHRVYRIANGQVYTKGDNAQQADINPITSDTFLYKIISIQNWVSELGTSQGILQYIVLPIVVLALIIVFVLLLIVAIKKRRNGIKLELEQHQLSWTEDEHLMGFDEEDKQEEIKEAAQDDTGENDDQEEISSEELFEQIEQIQNEPDRVFFAEIEPEEDISEEDIIEQVLRQPDDLMEWIDEILQMAGEDIPDAKAIESMISGEDGKVNTPKAAAQSLEDEEIDKIIKENYTTGFEFLDDFSSVWLSEESDEDMLLEDTEDTQGMEDTVLQNTVNKEQIIEDEIKSQRAKLLQAIEQDDEEIENLLSEFGL